VPNNEEKTANDVVIKGTAIEAAVAEVKGGAVLIERIDALELHTKLLEGLVRDTKQIAEDTKKGVTWTKQGIVIAIIVTIIVAFVSVLLQYFNAI